MCKNKILQYSVDLFAEHIRAVDPILPGFDSGTSCVSSREPPFLKFQRRSAWTTSKKIIPVNSVGAISVQLVALKLCDSTGRREGGGDGGHEGRHEIRRLFRTACAINKSNKQCVREEENGETINLTGDERDTDKRRRAKLEARIARG